MAKSNRPDETKQKPIFSRHLDIDKMAFMNWRMDKNSDIQNLLNLANGFMISSIILAQKCLRTNKNKKADIIIFPILTNLNHGIELYLKGITWTLNKLLNNPRKIEGSHNIDQIYKTVKAKIKLLGPDDIKEFDKVTKNLKAYIDELFVKIQATDKDHKMDFSRYPFTNKYDNHFYVSAVGETEVDLENFVKRIKSIRKNLELYSDYLYYQKLNAKH